MAEKSFIVAQNVSYAIHDQLLLSNISVTLGLQKTGLIGKNGVGKSTLLKLFVGQLQPSSGIIQRYGNIGYLPQDFLVKENKSVAQALRIDKEIDAIKRVESGTYQDSDIDVIGNDWDIVQQATILLAKLGLDSISLDRSVESLSGGELTRIGLAEIFLQKFDLIILDEPTNNLDRKAREGLYQLIRGFKGGCLIVSHDRELLNEMDQILELSSLGLNVYGGNYQQYSAQKKIEEQAKEREVADAQKFLKKTKVSVQKTKEKMQKKESGGKKKRASGSQTKMFYDAQQARSEKTQSKTTQMAEKQLQAAKERVQKAEASIEQLDNLHFDLEKTNIPATKIVVEIKNLSFHYPKSEPLFKKFNVTIRGPERIAIEGDNGSGKSTLLKLITQKLKPANGSIKIGIQTYAYLDQKTGFLDPKQTILENFQQMNPSFNVTECRTRLASLLFTKETVFKKVAILSGGERLRIALGCILLSEIPPQLIILDEPTNNMDLASIAYIERLMKNYQGALIVVSHDKTFLKNIGIEKTIMLSK